jgi:cytochrome c
MTPRKKAAAWRHAPWLLAVWLGAAVPACANQALATKHGCLGCHAAATKLVGPSYQEVAAKYSGDKAAVETLVKSIRNGGSGKWGDMAMPPQAQVSEADAKRLATWILGGAR